MMSEQSHETNENCELHGHNNSYNDGMIYILVRIIKNFYLGLRETDNEIGDMY